MTERTTLLGSDVQARRPSTYVSLSRVGVTGVEKVIRIRANGEASSCSTPSSSASSTWGPSRRARTCRASRRSSTRRSTRSILGEAFKAETLAAHIAERVRDRQEARRAEVTIAAHYPEHKQTPASGSPTQEIYKLFGSAVASARGTRRLVGVEAQGMTACPCAQEMVMDRSRERLARAGLHRGRDRARVRGGPRGDPQPARHRHALRRLPGGLRRTRSRRRRCSRSSRRSMSSEIYELMKRSDEVEVVEKAHMHPRFVEDCVREMVRMATERFASSARRASSRRARRTSRRSTSTTSWRSATACSESCAARSRRANARRTMCRCASGSTPAISPARAAHVSQLSGKGDPADDDVMDPRRRT